MTNQADNPTKSRDQTLDVVQSHLESIAAIAETVGMSSVHSELVDERIPALKARQMSMVVLGEFNHGKSTVINALLGNEIVPMGITPTTSVITHLVHGEGQAEFVFDDERKRVDPAELRKALTEDAARNLRYVEVPIASPFLEDGLVIVDTPGVNDISQQKAEITYGYVPRADIVVYVLDAAQALKRSEVTFIRERLIKNSHDRLFFVLGKSDSLTSDELKEVRSHVERKLRDLIGPTIIYPLSARRAMQGQDEGFDAFRAAIAHYIKNERDDILADGALRSGIRLGSILDHGISIESGALSLEVGELKDRVKRVRVRLDESQTLVSENVARIDKRTTEISAAAQANLEEFIETFCESLPKELARADVGDIKKYLPDFIHDRFREWLEHEGTHIALLLEQLAEEIIEITNRNMQEAVDAVESELGVNTRDLDFDVDTFGYDVGVFALGALGVSVMAFSNLLIGGALAIAAPVLAFALKGRIDNQVREQASEQGVAAIRKAGSKVSSELERMIQDFSLKLKEFVEDAGHRLYRQVAEVLDRVVSQRSEVSADVEPLLADLRASRDKVRAELREMKNLRASMRQTNPAPPTIH